jgi:sRNA-binding carbon storage regulator CsrA
VTEKNIDLDCLKMKAKDLAYTSVGIGILAFQKVQVRRRELSEEIDNGTVAPLVQEPLVKLPDSVPPLPRANAPFGT